MAERERRRNGEALLQAQAWLDARPELTPIRALLTQRNTLIATSGGPDSDTFELINRQLYNAADEIADTTDTIIPGGIRRALGIPLKEVRICIENGQDIPLNSAIIATLETRDIPARFDEASSEQPEQATAISITYEALQLYTNLFARGHLVLANAARAGASPTITQLALDYSLQSTADDLVPDESPFSQRELHVVEPLLDSANKLPVRVPRAWVRAVGQTAQRLPEVPAASDITGETDGLRQSGIVSPDDIAALSELGAIDIDPNALYSMVAIKYVGEPRKGSYRISALTAKGEYLTRKDKFNVKMDGSVGEVLPGEVGDILPDGMFKVTPRDPKSELQEYTDDIPEGPVTWPHKFFVRPRSQPLILLNSIRIAIPAVQQEIGYAEFLNQHSLNPRQIAGLKGEVIVLDVREPHEIEEVSYPGAIAVIRDKVNDVLDELSVEHPDAIFLTLCQSGARSAADLLERWANGKKSDRMFHADGGIAALFEAGLI